MAYYNDEMYDEDLIAANHYSHDLNRPVKVVNVNDRHVREIYRMPTPPPQSRRVVQRAPAPEPKIIERVVVRRPAAEIIENIIEVPPQEVRVINREKYLPKSEPIVRTKVVHLSHGYDQVQQQMYVPTAYMYPTQSVQYVTQYIQPTIPTYIRYRPIQVINSPIVYNPYYTSSSLLFC